MKQKLENAQHVLVSMKTSSHEASIGDWWNAIVDGFNKVVDWISTGIKILELVFKVLTEGADSALCVFNEAPKSILAGFEDLLGDPATYFDKWAKKLEKFMPVILDSTKRSVDGSLKMMDSIFNGKTVDIKPLQMQMLKDVKLMSGIDPVTKCLEPMIDSAYDALESSELELKLGGEGTLEQKIMDWVMTGPWMETIVPNIPILFDKAVKEAMTAVSSVTAVSYFLCPTCGMYLVCLQGDPTLDDIRAFIMGIMV